MRKESCYLNYESGECFNPMMHPQTKMLCCCSMGAAWGSPCEKCPAERTRELNCEKITFSKTISSSTISCLGEHEILCGQVPGQIMNPITNHTEEIDECALMPTMCTHGRCMNTPGSFECQCDRGYVYDQDSHQCIDENECLQVREKKRNILSDDFNNGSEIRPISRFPDSKSVQRKCTVHKQAGLLRMCLPGRIQTGAEPTRLRRHRRMLRATRDMQQRRVQQSARQFPVHLPRRLRPHTGQGQLRGYRRVSKESEYLQQRHLREHPWLVQVHLLSRIQA